MSKYNEYILKKFIEYITNLEDVTNIYDEDIMTRFIYQYKEADEVTKDSIKKFLQRQTGYSNKDFKGFCE